jgi:putative ABC transport system permease protein
MGIAAALGLTRLIIHQLFGTSARDPATFAGVAGLLLVVAVVACYVPARRAVLADPLTALRCE